MKTVESVFCGLFQNEQDKAVSITIKTPQNSQIDISKPRPIKPNVSAWLHTTRGKWENQAFISFGRPKLYDQLKKGQRKDVKEGEDLAKKREGSHARGSVGLWTAQHAMSSRSSRLWIPWTWPSRHEKDLPFPQTSSVWACVFYSWISYKF